MATILTTVTLHSDSNLPEDVAVNTWHTAGSNAIPDLIIASEDFRLFYVDIGPFLSATLNGTMTIRHYDLADPKPRQPRVTTLGAYVPNAAAEFPREVAVCLTLKSPVASGQDPRNHQNRKFIGPLAGIATHRSVVDAEVRPSNAMITAILDAGEALYDRLEGHARALLAYSPKLGAGGGINEISIDNAFDTQRRRGRARTQNVVRVVEP